MSRFFDTISIPEIHSSELFRGKAPFDRIDHSALVNEILDFISRAHITLFGIVINKETYLSRKKGPPNTIANTTLEEMVNRFHIYLQRHHTLGMIISDAGSSGFDTSIRNTYEYFRQQGTRFVTLNRIIDTIFFTPSETAMGIQMADFVAFVIRTQYEHADGSFFPKINRKFDTFNRKTHGFKLID